jgi:HSP20 family molecular chaperone IbpA
MASPTTMRASPAQIQQASQHPVPVRHEHDAFSSAQHYFNKMISEVVNAPTIFSLMRNNGFSQLWNSGNLEIVEPSIDISESNKAYKIRTELPGVEDKDIEVYVNDDYLTIKGKKSEERSESDERCVVRERSYGSFQRVLKLPELASSDKAKALFKNGVLTIEVPKKHEATRESQKLEIRTA